MSDSDIERSTVTAPTADSFRDIAAEAERLRVDLRTDPYVLRRLHDFERRGGLMAPPVTTARQVIAEQRMTSLTVLSGKVPLTRLMGDGLYQADAKPEHYDRYGVLFHQAIPYLWLNSIQDLAFSHNLPRHIVGRPDLPHPLMYWSFEGSLPALGAGNKEIGMVLDAMLVWQSKRGLSILMVVSKWESQPPSGRLELLEIAPGARYPEDIIPVGRQVLAMIAFLNSPYVVPERQLTHRPGAKAKWHGRRIGDPMALHVVALRSSIKEAVAVERGEGPQWKSRWLVRGHYRAQWYASLKAHKVIWIAPYLKGPEDAPMQPQAYAVVR